jgi:hypothetical protein
MFIQDVLERLNAIEILPELREGLQQMAKFDVTEIAKSTHLGIILLIMLHLLMLHGH